MGRAHQGHSYGRAFLRQVIAEWQRRGESAAARARRVDVSKASLFRSRAILAHEAPPRVPAFVTVDVIRDPADPSAGAVEVVLANGRRLRCGAGADPARCAQLVAALERPVC